MMDEPNNTEPTIQPLGRCFSPPPGPGMDGLTKKHVPFFLSFKATKQAFTDASPTTRAPSISSIAITDFHAENNVWDNDPFTDAL